MENRWGNNGNSDTLFSWTPKSLQMMTAAMKLKDTCFLEEKLWETTQYIKKQRYHFANKGLSSQRYGFSSRHVWIWELDYKESWVLKNWCFRTVVLENTLESPLDSKEIQPVNPKGNQPWIFIRRTDAKAEAPIVWPPDEKSQLVRKDWCWERLKAGEQGDDRGRDGWRASLTQRTWVWASSRRWWRTGKPGILHSMRSQRVGHD